jgi:hypothetical protein
MLAAVAAFGVSGSAFSVGQTVIGMASSSKIPEHVANHWATLMRTFFGSITGLAGYVFYSSQVIRIQVGDGQNKMATAMTIAFVFGYAGEKLISKIVDSIGSSGTRNAK